MSKQKISLFALTLLTAAVLVGVSTSALVSHLTIPSIGRIKTVGVGVYWNSTCTNVVSTIDWETVEPGSSKNVTVYIRNEGNSVSTLSLNTSNWNPSSASNYISLSWDYRGQKLSPNQVMQVTLTLSISSSIKDISNFSFDITISATA